VAARSQDAEELETLYIGLVRDYHRRIYNYVFRMIGDMGTAEDLTQEVYLRAFRALPRLAAGSNHRAWLFRIATNAATDELRRRRRRPDVMLGLTPNHRARTPSEDERLGRVCLDKALLAIGDHHRAVLMLFEFAEFTAPEVGEVLGITPEAARKRRQRAREALARVLDGAS
jgi:RNA polymerase sigma-70 factor (ECF subfamily)